MSYYHVLFVFQGLEDVERVADLDGRIISDLI